MTPAELKMRAAPLLSLLIPAVLGVALAGCHKDPAQAEAASPRGLKVEAYDAVIPKAPLKGKLETMAQHPAALAGTSAPPAVVLAPPASAEPQPEALAAPPPRRLDTLRAADHPSAAGPVDPAPNDDIYNLARPPGPDEDPSAQPGFRVTLAVCRRAAQMNDPLAQTPQCREMLRIAREQARLCAKAFADGDDRIVLSPACRQAARAR